MSTKNEQAVVDASFFRQLRQHAVVPLGAEKFFYNLFEVCDPRTKVYMYVETDDNESSINLETSSDSNASYDSEDSEEEEQYHKMCVDEMRRMKKGNYFVVEDRLTNKKQKRI